VDCGVGTRLARAFPSDQCQEAANLLEEFADKLEAIIRSPQAWSKVALATIAICSPTICAKVQRF
jgi:hypothetical protein